MPKKVDSTEYSTVAIPQNMARAGWDLDTEEILRLCRDFDIRWPVKFRWITGKYRRGTHYTRWDGNGNFWHQITVDQNRSLEDSLRTVLHELRHAIQTETYARNAADLISGIRTFSAEYRKEGQSNTNGYNSNRFEQDANEFMEKWQHEYKVVY